MGPELVKSARTRIRLPVATFTAVCGVAAAVGSLLTWVSARDARPRMGMDHTSFSGMLVYSFANGNPFWKSVGFVVLVLGGTQTLAWRPATICLPSLPTAWPPTSA